MGRVASLSESISCRTSSYADVANSMDRVYIGRASRGTLTGRPEGGRADLDGTASQGMGIN